MPKYVTKVANTITTLAATASKLGGNCQACEQDEIPIQEQEVFGAKADSGLETKFKDMMEDLSGGKKPPCDPECLHGNAGKVPTLKQLKSLEDGRRIMCGNLKRKDKPVPVPRRLQPPIPGDKSLLARLKVRLSNEVNPKKKATIRRLIAKEMIRSGNL